MISTVIAIKTLSATKYEAANDNVGFVQALAA